MSVNNSAAQNAKNKAEYAAEVEEWNRWMARKPFEMAYIHKGMPAEKQTKELLKAAAKGDSRLVYELIVGSVINVPLDSVDKDGNTAFHIAAQHGHKSVIISLLVGGDWTVDIINMRNNAGKTAAEEAAQRGFKEIVEILTVEIFTPAWTSVKVNNYNGGRRSKSRKVKRSKSRKVKRSKSRKVNRKH